MYKRTFTLIYLTNQFKHTAAGPLVFPPLTPVANYVSGYNIFYQGYVVTSIISFILTWIATVYYFIVTLKYWTAKYWILVSIPLVYFLSQFQFVFVDMFTSFRIRSNSVWNCLHIILPCDYPYWRSIIWYRILECRPKCQS